MKRFLGLALLMSLSSSMLFGQCDWSFVHHDSNNSRNNPCETTLTPANVGSLVVKWSDTSSSVSVTAVVKNDNVYYGNWAGVFQRRDAQTGVVLASRTFPGQVFGSPATVSDDTVYVSTNDLILHVLDPITLADKPGFIGGISIDPSLPAAKANIYSGPVLVENLVIVGLANSNEEETTTLFPTFRGGFYAFDITNGSLVWHYVVNPAPLGTGGGSFSTAAIDTKLKLMFVGTSNATTPPAGPHTDALLAIDYRTGVLKWAQQYTKDDVWSALYPCGGDLDLGASPNLFTICKKGKKDLDVVGANSKVGCYRVFERKTGKPVWRSTVNPKDAVPSINGAPGAAVANDTVFALANSDNSGIPFNVLSILAQYGLPCRPDAFVQLVTSIATTDQTNIRALDARTGCVKWIVESVAPSYPSMTHANGVLYTANAIGIVRALDAQTGGLLFTDTLPGVFPANLSTGSVTVTEGRVFVSAGIGGPGGLFVYGLP